MHWEYGLNSSSKIASRGFSKNNSFPDLQYRRYIICKYLHHLTHFGMLISDIEDNRALSIITTLGPSFSFVGALILFADMYIKRIKLTKANIMFINFVIVTVVIPIFMYGTDLLNKESTEVYCKMAGVFLHYLVLTQFTFSSIIAYFHYLRFVVIFRNVEDVAIKCTIIALTVPVIPVSIFALISLDNYKNEELCFLSGFNKKVGVVIPILMSLTFNISLFFVIFRSLNKSYLKGQPGRKNTYIYKWGYSFTLISCVGWIFGMLVTLDGGIFFSYVFSILSSLQGFLLTLSFIRNEAQKFVKKNTSVSFNSYIKISQNQISTNHS